MIEIKFSAVSRSWLNHRISTMEKLEQEILALDAERNLANIKINWQFSIHPARTTLNSQTSAVQGDNKIFQES